MVSANLEGIITLLNIETKGQLEKYCRSFVLKSSDFVAMILVAKTGGLDPYKYAVCFKEWSPPHLALKDSDLDALSANGIGLLAKPAKKTINKVFQMITDRRMLAAHLLYTPDYDYWFLFYLDQRDQETDGNHWKHGPHIHLVSYHWPNLKLQDVWDGIQKGQADFPNKTHLRWVGSSLT